LKTARQQAPTLRHALIVEPEFRVERILCSPVGSSRTVESIRDVFAQSLEQIRICKRYLHFKSVQK
jgi:RNase P/RNase MRP subunit POP5